MKRLTVGIYALHYVLYLCTLNKSRLAGATSLTQWSTFDRFCPTADETASCSTIFFVLLIRNFDAIVLSQTNRVIYPTLDKHLKLWWPISPDSSYSWPTSILPSDHLPDDAAKEEHVKLSQGQPWVLNHHFNTSRWPPEGALEHVVLLQSKCSLHSSTTAAILSSDQLQRAVLVDHVIVP